MLLIIMALGITRLCLYYQHQKSKNPWPYAATGWLADQDTIVTAAHCVVNKKLKVSRIEAFVSYDTGKNGSRQMRRGTHVAIHHSWSKFFKNKYDIAYIRLERPFIDTPPMRISSAPDEAVSITVPGYPGMIGNGRRMQSATCDCKERDIKTPFINYDNDTLPGMSAYLCTVDATDHPIT